MTLITDLLHLLWGLVQGFAVLCVIAASAHLRDIASALKEREAREQMLWGSTGHTTPEPESDRDAD